MSRFPMDRYSEQRLIEEVRYLHSLWHQGPPRPHPTIRTPVPTPVSLLPSSSTQFKKKKKKSKKTQIADSGIEWPCPSPAKSPAPTDSGWPSFTTKSNAQPHLPTSTELAHFAANQAQQHALKAVSDYLKYSHNGDDDDDVDDENDGSDAMETEEGVQDYEFFEKLFAEDGSLREYYEKNHDSGEFSCLVCCGLGKKGWRKRFKDCVAIVQHSVAIANTNNRQAHRAYGQVICKVLGWDINRLPSIVLSAGDKLNDSSNKPVNVQGDEDDGGKNGSTRLSNTTDAVNIRSDEVSQLKESSSNGNQQETGGSSVLLEGDEDDGGKNGSTRLSNTTDAVNIRSDEVSQLKESSSNGNQLETGGSSVLLEGNEDDGGKNGLTRCSDGVSQLEESSSNGNQQETGGSSVLLEGNEDDAVKNGSLGIVSNTIDTANTGRNIGSNEVSQPKESFGNENQQGNIGNSQEVEHNTPNEINANRNLEDISNDIPETTKETAEGASISLEPSQEGNIVANGENTCRTDDVSQETTISGDNLNVEGV